MFIVAFLCEGEEGSSAVSRHETMLQLFLALGINFQHPNWGDANYQNLNFVATT